MADNKQNPNQKDRERTNDAVGLPADQQNQRGNTNMETQGGNPGTRNMSGGSDRVDQAGDATHGDSSNRQGQGSSSNQMENTSNRQGNDMQEKRPSGSNERGDEGKDREKRPA